MKFIRSINIKNQYTKYQIPFLNSTYLIKWYPNSKTNIHSHKGKDCDFVPLWGDLHEVRYKNKINTLYCSYNSNDTRNPIIENNLKYKEKKVKQLHLSHINDDKGKHQIFNYDNYIKWSIHKYY